MFDTVKHLIESRVSTTRYNPDRDLSEAEITELVRLAARAPSAYNFQNWKFIAVRSDEAKTRLQAVSFGQRQVVDAPVTFIICGTLKAHKALPGALQPSVDAGVLSPSVFDAWVTQAAQSHRHNPQLQRDEAFRSASLAAMILMIAAQGMGLATGAMSGFDPTGVAREFDLQSTDVPVMLITVGYPTADNWPQKPRKSLQEIMPFA